MITFNIIDQADQKFSAILNNRRVTLRLRYNPTNDRWTFDLSIDDEPVLHGRKIVPGTDLLAPFNFGIGSIFAYSATNAKPDRNSLINGTVALYHATKDEVNAAMAS